MADSNSWDRRRRRKRDEDNMRMRKISVNTLWGSSSKYAYNFTTQSFDRYGGKKSKNTYK